MIGILIAAALAAGPSATPGPDSPVCEPGQVSWVDGCAQPQLPGETVGREIGDGPFPPAAETSPAAVTVLAYTGVPEGPYAAAAAGLILTGAGLLGARRRWAR